MVNFLNNKGFFHAMADAKIVTSRKNKSKAIFTIKTGPQFKISTVTLKKDTSRIYRDIESDFRKSLLKQGAPYNLDLIKAERSRIDRMLKEKGYYFFNPDYILVIVDSSIGNNKVDMYVELKHDDIPEEAYNVYVLNNIFIYANYQLHGHHQDTNKENAVTVDSYHLIDSKRNFHRSVFSNTLTVEQGDKYSLDDQNTTISRLVNLGVFKFVKNRLEPVDDTLLDVYYYLTPYPKKAIRLEVGAVTTTDNRTGTRGSISWRHRNAFKGAEQFRFTVNSGIETQISNVTRRSDIYTFGTEASLAFPRFVVPFWRIHTLSRYLPRTIVKLKYQFETEQTLVNIHSFTSSYGYDWKPEPRKEHQLYPINLTYVTTDTLNNSDQFHLLYTSLFFNGIILGPTYEYTFNSQLGTSPRNGFYFDGLIDLSGNILGLIEGADISKNPQTLFGSTYAQYVKLQPDLRYYWHLSNISTFVVRGLMGIGIPYGNSNQLPNVKQFWAGGNSDLRGFPSRLVGPGTFNGVALANVNNIYLQTLGDLKLEFNAEYRRKIYKAINGALFTDVGNIWLYRDNPSFPGGAFTSAFLSQLAVDVGIGARLDFTILVLRLDLGFPVRKPWSPVYNAPSWSGAILNVAIGYPF